MKLHGFVAGTALVAALTLTACGGSSGGTTGGGAAQTLAIASAAGAELKYDKSVLEAKANKPFKVTFSNKGSVQHNFLIKGKDGQPVGGVPSNVTTAYLDPAANGTSGEVTLPAGSYEFYCSFPGHEAMMKGQVVVQP